MKRKFGPYEICAIAGEGGMGRVYRASDLRLGREVAIKVLSLYATGDPGRRRRFENEARAVSRLNHPNILTIFDIGEHRGQPYIVSEFLHGETLRAVIERGPVPVKRLLDIAVQLADGLAAAHGAGITHRDLKPENVILTKDGLVKILDFGLAKVANPGPDEDTVRIAERSEPGVVMGTVAYMSPEQARGGALDYRTDQFSLGILLHQMLTGQQPFRRASAPETMTAIIKEEPPQLDSTVPPPLRWAIERTLAKDPEDRYTSTKDLYRELRTLKERLPEMQGSGAPTQRRRWPPTATAVIASLLMAIVVTIYLSRSVPPPLIEGPPRTIVQLRFVSGDLQPPQLQVVTRKEMGLE